MNELIGLKINNVFINQEKNVVRLDTDFGEVFLVAVGDCCSKTWFEHISGIKNIKGGQVIEEFNTNYFDEPYKQVDNDEYDIDKYYSTVIKTTKGNLELEFRNNSNGYYGGRIEVNAMEYGDPIDKEDDRFTQEFKELKKDF
jgi:hypothetical protein